MQPPPLNRWHILIVAFLVCGYSLTGCSKNSNSKKNDTDTVPARVVYDSAKFHADFSMLIYNTSGVYPDTFYDYSSIVIYVVNGVVKIPKDSFYNDPPIVQPPSGSGGIYKAVWIPDDIGEINITDAGGIVIPGGDTEVVVTLTQTGTVSPKWQLTSGGVTTTGGGISTPGWPSAFNFSTKQKETAVIDLNQPGSHFRVFVFKDY